MTQRVVKVEYKDGYQIRHIEISGEEAGGGRPFVMQMAFTPEGDFVGTPYIAFNLIVKRGIKPELATPSSSICSVGFCASDQRWYGWSHRAVVGFGVGDKLFDESFPAEDTTPFVERGGETILTLEQARQAAVNFAAYIS